MAGGFLKCIESTLKGVRWSGEMDTHWNNQDSSENQHRERPVEPVDARDLEDRGAG